MTVAAHAAVPEARSDNRRPEPRWMTLADLGVIVVAVALVLRMPWRGLALPPYNGL